MFGPYKITAEIYCLTAEGDTAVAKVGVGAGEVLTVADMDRLTQSAERQARAAGVEGLRPMTRNEFANMLIKEANPMIGHQTFVTKEAWDEPEADYKLAALRVALADLTLNDSAHRVVEDAIAKAEGTSPGKPEGPDYAHGNALT